MKKKVEQLFEEGSTSFLITFDKAHQLNNLVKANYQAAYHVARVAIDDLPQVWKANQLETDPRDNYFSDELNSQLLKAIIISKRINYLEGLKFFLKIFI